MKGKSISGRVFIGLGNRGTDHLNWFMENEDVEVAALCDVYELYIRRDRSAVIQRRNPAFARFYDPPGRDCITALSHD